MALDMVAHSTWGNMGFLGFLITASLLLIFLLSPALLELKLGHGEKQGEHWWENDWIKRSTVAH